MKQLSVKRTLLIIILFTLLLCPTTSCTVTKDSPAPQQATPPPTTAIEPTSPSPTPPSKTSIAFIRAEPAAYEGRVITIEGKYQGWKGGFGEKPPETRSDWLVEDDTGWIYVTGKPSGLDPIDDVGHPIKITGIVKITRDGEPYLSAGGVIIGEKVATMRIVGMVKEMATLYETGDSAKGVEVKLYTYREPELPQLPALGDLIGSSVTDQYGNYILEMPLELLPENCRQLAVFVDNGYEGWETVPVGEGTIQVDLAKGSVPLP